MTTDFYHIQQQETGNNECFISFLLNPGHAIFKGHFPGNPVLPGVCMIQIIKDVFSTTTGLNMFLKTVQHVKFLEVIVPDEQTMLTLNMSWTTLKQNEWMVQTDLKRTEKTFCKFKGIFSSVA